MTDILDEPLSPRILKLRERALARGNHTGEKKGVRALAFMKAYEENPGISWGQWRALGLLELARLAPVSLKSDERIFGEHFIDNAEPTVDFYWTSSEAKKQLADMDLSEKDKKKLKAFFKRVRSFDDSLFTSVGAKNPQVDVFSDGFKGDDKGIYWARGWVENHSVRDFAKVVRIGFQGIRAEILDLLESVRHWEPDYPEKRNFWLTALSVCDAGITLGRRYAEVARKLADDANDTQLKAHYEEIAAVAERVPAHGAGTLREAIQALWFAHVLTCGEDCINANSIGRLDQILYPYYREDIDSGRLDKRGALELMEELACKLYLDYDVQQICLGGQTPDGSDGANDLTYLILDATEHLDFIRCISIRLHKNSPRALIKQSARMVAKGGGIPFFFNDHAIIKALTDRDIALEDARDYAPIGCVEITIPGRANPHAVSGWFNGVKCLELALFDGWDPRTGKQLGPKTGKLTDFESFDELMEAYKKQTEYFAQWMVYECNRGEIRQRERGPMPCWSVMTDECIARGRDITNGGPRYNYQSICFLGVPNVADSLAAIRKLVFNEKSITPGQLHEALKCNFEGAENIRLKLLHKAPKYGNGVEEVDELAAEVAGHFCRLLDNYRTPLGARYFVHLFTFVCHIGFGGMTGATPDGRFAGDPLAYSLSPQQGRDEKGITAMMNSLARIPHELAAGSSSAIIEIDPVLVEGEKGLERLADIITTGVSMGIGQMQFNVASAERLEKALEDPERYGNIQVRVSGYSSKFNLLNRELQNHIIARTKHRT